VGVGDLEQVTRGTPWHNTHEDAGKDVRVVARDIACDGRDGPVLPVNLANYSSLLQLPLY